MTPTAVASLALLLTLAVTFRGVSAYAPLDSAASYEAVRSASYGLIKEMVLAEKRMHAERQPRRPDAEELASRASRHRGRQGMPDLKSMPVAGYVVWGRTHCNSTNNPQNLFTRSQHQSYSLVAYYVNEVRGGILVGGQRYLVRDVNYNDGADCTLMKILYEYMVDVEGAQFLFAPVNPDCSVLAKFAESRGLLYGNGGDYSLLILRNTPNATTPFDTEPWAQAVGYDDLQWTYNGMNDITQGGASCAEALTNPQYIDQSRVKAGDPPAKVRTAVFGSNAAEVPFLAATQKAQLVARNVTELEPELVWQLKKIVDQRDCSYIGPDLERWKALRPDFIYMITGASNATIGFECLHRLDYQPPALMNPTALATDQDESAVWHTIGLVQETPFFASINFVDQIFGDYQTFFDYYALLYNESATFYELTFASTAVVLLACMENIGTTTNMTAIRDCIRAFNQSTIYGDIHFNPNGWFVDRPNVCLQKIARGSYSVAFPLDYPNQADLLIPSQFVMNQTWLSQFKQDRSISKTNIAIIVVCSVIGAALIVTTGVWGFLKSRYRVMFFPKTVGSSEW